MHAFSAITVGVPAPVDHI